MLVDLNHAYAKFSGKALFDQTDFPEICLHVYNSARGQDLPTVTLGLHLMYNLLNISRENEAPAFYCIKEHICAHALQTKKRFAKEWAEAEKATQQAEKTENDLGATRLEVEKVNMDISPSTVAAAEH